MADNFSSAPPNSPVDPSQPPMPPQQPPAAPPQGAPPPPPPQAPLENSGGKKKLLIVIGGVLLLVMLLVGALMAFGDQWFAQESSDPVTLTYWGLWESPEIMQPIIDEYESANPNVTINYEQRPIEEHYATVKSRISEAGASDSFPDIVRVHNSWVPILSNYLSRVPENIYSREEYEAAFYEVTRDTLLIDGQYYALPLMTDGLALVYNKELFSEAGITAPPATWDDVRRDAAKIAQRDARGNLTVAGIAMGAAHNVDHFADIIGLLMAQNGVVFMDSTGNVNFHNSITADGRNLGAEALSFYNLFTSRSEEVWSRDMEPSTLAFSKGKVGMVLMPSWRILSLLNQNPGLQIGVAPVPHLTTDQTVGYATYWVEAVPRASSNQAAAWKFLRFLSERENQLNVYNSAQQERLFGAPYSRQDLASALQNDPIMRPFATQAAGYRTALFATNTGAVELNDAINTALAEAINKSGTSTDTAASSLEDLSETVTMILTEQRE